MTRVVVHVDRLVLNGFRHEDRHAIALGLQEELGRVFANRESMSYLTAVRDRPHVHVAGVHIEPGSQPQHVGQHVARGIGNEIGK
jgi:hypothetical protein